MSSSFLEADRLAQELERSIAGEVRFDRGSRGLYATDASNYRQVPIGVVVPRRPDDVEATVDACRRHGVPILGRGGGTSLAGQCCNVAVVIDFSKYLHGLLELDAEAGHARVQPGIILDDLRRAAQAHGLTFGPDPATHSHCTLGGMIGNNSCGPHSVMAGMTADNVEELEVLTYDGLRLRVGATDEEELERIIAAGGRKGEIYARLRGLRDRYADLIRQRYPDIPRRVSGYNLDHLLPENGFHVARALVGTESTCALTLQATMRLVPAPAARVLVVLGYPDVFQAADQVPDIMAHRPVALEGLDDVLVSDMEKKGLHPEDVALLPEGNGWLLVEFGGGTTEEAAEQAGQLTEALRADRPSVKVFDDPEQQEHIWEVRESGLGATARVPGESDTWTGWEDSAVPPERLGDYLRDLRGLFEEYGYHASLYGHFGQGCIHTRIDFDLLTADGVKRFRSFIEEAAGLVVSYGGSLSGEHGDGQSRAELLDTMFGEELVGAFGEFKAIWDPEGMMNPGKVVDPRPLDQDLRLGPDYRPWQPPTHFSFPEDDGNFARAALRCVGVGECRRLEEGTMCPSYMVTREERHSTRGRARLLFEMLQGDVVKGGWRDPHVKEALDLCLACKGCKSDCPVQVDMATYKAEFLSHFYRRRLRPRAAYSMGLIYWWARLGSLAPTLANLVTQTPGLRRLAKAAGGVAPGRDIPRFAPETFRAWFSRRSPAETDGPRVMLWADTFTDHFEPAIPRAAVAVLEQAGFQVTVPEMALCCGRPLYDYGMLPTAKRLLRRVVGTLQPAIEEGTPVVGLEPSCVAVFRDELPNLFPHDEDARRLSRQTSTIGEFLTGRGYRPPRLEGKALVHGHCHHEAVMGLQGETALLDGLGLDYRLLDSGCCGMAGSFGFERDKYRVAMAVGERVLLPAVREADQRTLIITDGFSCREQIRQATGRRALHLVEVVEMAINGRRTST